MATVGAAPFAWTPEIEAEIFDRMIGGESIRTICGVARDSFLPCERTFYKRASTDAEFAQHYARAREAQGHREAEEIREIADTATPDDVHVARLRIDARKWRAGKLAPKVYGDKQVIEGPGPKGEHMIETTDVTPIDLARRIAFALAAGLEDTNGKSG
jgi:hypothetical protein